MNRVFAIVILSSIVGLTSLQAESKNCLYEYDPSTTKLDWTAYKFTEKTGVKGNFSKFVVTGAKKSDSITKSISQIKFQISKNDLTSFLPDRDAKIQTYFFGSSNKANDFTGRFENIIGDEKGNADLILSFNGFTKKIPISFTLEENSILATGELDVLDFGMGTGIQKLNEICYDLHKGTDGVSKLWSTVSFKISSNFKSNCKE
jgi:hypothetical protein